MCRYRSILVLLLLSLPLWAGDEEPLEQLKARAEQATGGDQVKLYIEVARRQLTAADRFFDHGDIEQGQAAVREVATYCERAGDAAGKSGKKLKDTEITIRKMAKRLTDIQKGLNLEDRPAVQEAVNRMQKVRDQLLSRMFSKDGKS